MKTYLISIAFCLITSFIYSQDNSDWIELNNGDTLNCKVWSLSNGTLIYKPKITVDIGDGRKLNYSVHEIISLQKGDTIFWSARFRPWRADSDKLVFIQVLMQSGNQFILKYENVIGTEWGPQYDLKYYHYEGKVFKDEVKNGNYREIMEEYFASCQYIKDLLSEKKNFFYYDRLTQVAREYRKNCQLTNDY